MSTRLLAHAGELNSSLGVRLAVVFKQLLPNDPMHALVIKFDSIQRDSERTEVIEALNSREANDTRDFAYYLSSKGLLEQYHKRGYLTKVHIDEINMTPTPGQKIPLRTIINQINQMNGVAPLPTQAQLDNLSTSSPMSGQQQQELINQDGRRSIAKGLLAQAHLMQTDVNRKLEEAYGIDPSLRPVGQSIAKGTTSIEAIMSIPEDETKQLNWVDEIKPSSPAKKVVLAKKTEKPATKPIAKTPLANSKAKSAPVKKSSSK